MMFNIGKVKHHKPEGKDWMKDRRNNDVRRIPMCINELPANPGMLSAIAEYASDTAFYDLYFDGNLDSFIEHLRLAHLSRTWHWKGMFDRGPHKVHLPNEVVFSSGLMLPNIGVRLGTFLEGVYLAITFRDHSAFDVYRTVPFDALQSRLGSNHKPFLNHWMNFLKIVGTDSPNIQAEFNKAYELSAPDGDITAGRVDWLTNIFRPFVCLWQPILDNDPDEFNRVLRVQQKKWKAYHSVERHLRNRISGFYCMPALAAVCYANDLGFPITVKSDYLPNFLVKGDFPRLEWPNPEWVENHDR